MKPANIWLAVGFIGQALFGARFLVQWLSSERQKRSVIPMAFWYLSLCGGLILLSYAIFRRDPVFVVGQVTGAAIYLRNIQLRFHERRDKPR
ncbi:MAG: lipid-A-disaccharide synthase N-terminal domain-containing protein [Woeseiaceae bacterium]